MFIPRLNDLVNLSFMLERYIFASSYPQVVMLSDLFTERPQFDWMLKVLLELLHSRPLEDELVSQYLVIGICKASAVLGVVSVSRFKNDLEYEIRKLEIMKLSQSMSTVVCMGDLVYVFYVSSHNMIISIWGEFVRYGFILAQNYFSEQLSDWVQNDVY